MDDEAFDTAMVTAAFALAAREGWGAVSVAEAAREAELPLGRARARFPARHCLLLRFGEQADRYALTGAATEGPVRDRLFDLLMRRFDFLNRHREGVLAVLRDPMVAAALLPASLASMGWMLEAAGGSARGLRGALRAKGLLAVWLWTLRAWRADESEDLAHTMSELDKALARAGQVAEAIGDRDGASEPEPETPDAPPATPPVPPPV